MKYILSVLITVLLLNLNACKGQNSYSEALKQISIDEFEKLRKTDKGILLDVRTLDEIVDGFIEGAVFSDYYSDNFEAIIAKYPKEKTVYIYCRSGNRSNKAAKIFVKNGFSKVYNIKGGMNAWKAANKDVKKK